VYLVSDCISRGRISQFLRNSFLVARSRRRGGGIRDWPLRKNNFFFGFPNEQILFHSWRTPTVQSNRSYTSFKNHCADNSGSSSRGLSNDQSLHSASTSSVLNRCVMVASSHFVVIPTLNISQPACAIMAPLSMQNRISVA